VPIQSKRSEQQKPTNNCVDANQIEQLLTVLEKSCCLYDFSLSEDYIRDKDRYNQHVTYRFIMQCITENGQKISREQDKRRREHRGNLQGNTQVLRTCPNVQPRRCFREHGLPSLGILEVFLLPRTVQKKRRFACT
jgi:hypothetical protein